jgi:Family of unknown function (DUF6680)
MIERTGSAMADTLFGMEVKDWVTCAAIVLGPIFAVQAQKFVEGIKEAHERRLKLFKTLMSTRSERLSRDHVQALNMIHIDFFGHRFFRYKWQYKDEKAVTDAWKIYNYHLNDKTYKTMEDWNKRGDELFTELLFKMSKALGYDFEEVQLKSDAYRPVGLASVENAQIAVLDGLARLLNNEKYLRVEVMNVPPSASLATDTNKTPQ